ncbi:hypothetical protein [Pedobacter panaciterrae]
MKRIIFCVLCLVGLISVGVFAQQTKVVYLSGTDKDNTVKWEFFCTKGMNSGKWTEIPVPSQWELQGFGGYNYGHDKKNRMSRGCTAIILKQTDPGLIKRFNLFLKG